MIRDSGFIMRSHSTLSSIRNSHPSVALPGRAHAADVRRQLYGKFLVDAI